MTERASKNVKDMIHPGIMNNFQVVSLALISIGSFLPFASIMGVNIIPIEDTNLISPVLILLSGIAFAFGLTRYLGRILLGLVYLLWITSIIHYRQEIEVIQEMIGFENLFRELSIGAFLLIPGLALGAISIFLPAKANIELSNLVLSKVSNINASELKRRAASMSQEVSSEGGRLVTSIKSGEISKKEIKAFAMKKSVMIGIGSVFSLILIFSLTGGGGPISAIEAKQLLEDEFRGYGITNIEVGKCEQDTDYDRYYDCQWSGRNALFGQEISGNWAGFQYITGRWVVDYID